MWINTNLLPNITVFSWIYSNLLELSALERLPILEYGGQWQDQNGIHFALWGSGTKETPYTQGLTDTSAGIAIGGRISENNQFWLSIDANGHMFRIFYNRQGGGWTDWIAL